MTQFTCKMACNSLEGTHGEGPKHSVNQNISYLANSGFYFQDNNQSQLVSSQQTHLPFPQIEVILQASSVCSNTQTETSKGLGCHVTVQGAPGSGA